MPDTIEQFFTRFAAGAGSQYQWSLKEWEGARGTQWSLRVYVEAPGGLTQEMCPLSAQATYESGHFYSTPHWINAALSLRMGGWVPMDPLVSAADGDPDADPVLRTRLCRICGLTDPNTTEKD